MRRTLKLWMSATWAVTVLAVLVALPSPALAKTEIQWWHAL